MTVQNLYKRGAQYGWMPDSDEYNAPDGALLLATNCVPDIIGVQSLRLGSSLIYSGFTPQNVHSLWTTELFNSGNPFVYRYFAIDDRVFRNGTDLGASFDGVGDIAFCDDSYQTFMARGLTKKKDSGTQFHNWGIAAPSLKATLAAVTNLYQDIATFNSAESPAIVVHEGTSNGFIAGWDGTANGALSVSTGASTGRASLSKTYSSVIDLQDIKGAEGSDTDLFDFFIWIEEPREFVNLRAMFGLATTSDPFAEDRYEFDFNPNKTVELKDAASSVASVDSTAVEQSVSTITPEEFIMNATTEQVQTILDRIGKTANPASQQRLDAQQTSPAWYRFSVTRGQFRRIGSTPGRDWRTVKAFKLVYDGLAGSSTNDVAFDSAIFIGGGDSSLTGKYRIGYRYIRNTGQYVEKSPMSPLSDPIVLNQQGLQITIPSGAILGADPQVNGLWIYIVGGFIPSLYRCAVTGLDSNPGAMSLDEFARVPDGTISMADMARITSPGFTLSTSSTSTSSASIIFTLSKSDVQILTENQRLEPFASLPPDNIVSIAGPFSNRMFCLTKDGWLWPSAQDSPSNYAVSWALDLRRYGKPLWSVRTNGGIHCGFTKDVIRIAGTGDESEDHLTVDLFAEPLHVGNPPVDASVYTDGNIVVYRSADGLMTLSGVTLASVSQGPTSLLWQGVARHGVLPLNTESGRFRFVVDKQVLFMLAPEGEGTTGTAQSADTLTLTLEAGSSSIDDFFTGRTLRISGGTGAGQVRGITDYVGSTLVATVNNPWDTIPDGTSTYELLDEATPTIWRYAFGSKQWSRTAYRWSFLSIFRDPGGPLIAGTDTGELVLLEDGTQDDGQDIPVDVLYPVQDDGKPFNRKVPFDSTFEGTTGGTVGDISFIMDGVTTTYPFSTSAPGRYRLDVSELPNFLRGQIRLTGSFNSFKVQSVNLSYRDLPQHTMVLDTGYILPQEPKDFVDALEVEVDCISPAAVELLYYLDDVVYREPLDVPNDGRQAFVPNVRSNYRVVLPKGSKARRPRIKLRTTNANGRGEIGFECYGIRIKERSTGNTTALGMRTVWPVGQVA